MQHLTLRSLFTIAALGLGAPLAAAQAVAPVRFHLEAGSSYKVGCLPPCFCPVTSHEVRGTLEMTRVEPPPLFADVYLISNVMFLVGEGSGPSILVTGGGIYWNSVQLGPQQRLELDLVIGGAAPAHFETDWVTDGAADFPRFEIAVAENGFFCNDRVWNLSLAPELFTNFCTSTPNSSGGAALISVSGTHSVVANDLALHASPVPALQPGIFFFGPRATQVPFGDGFRCIAGLGLRRLWPTAASAAGELSFALDNTSLPGGMSYLPGTTWLFQGWFRDPAAGQSGFNLSDGAAVLFEL